MNLFHRLGNGLDAFRGRDSNAKSISFDGQAGYMRDAEGNHNYTFGSESFGFLGLLGLGIEYNRPQQNLKYYYANTIFLQDCINLYADFASQVMIKEVDEKGNEIPNSEYVKFLENPNPFQNRTEFIKEMTINLLSYGASFQNGSYFKNGNLRINPLLYNLDYNCLSFPKVKDRYSIKRDAIKELIIKEHLADSKTRNIPFSELVYFYDTIANNGYGNKGYSDQNYFKPMARLFSILSSLNTLINSQSSMEYISANNVNKLIYKKQLTGGAVAPLDDDQKFDIERKVNGRGKYGAIAGKIGDTIATNEDLGILDLTRDSRKMMLIETKESAKEDVRNCFLIPKDFFSDSTYENKQFSEARLILGSVKTVTDNWLNALTNKTPGYFEVSKTKLVGTYDHIPSVAETKKKLESEAFLNKTKGIDAAVATYNNMKLVQPNLTWDSFLINHQLDQYLKVQ